MKLKRIITFCLSLVLMVSFTTTSFAATNQRVTTTKLPILLKMNQFYVVSVKPNGPYLTKDNQLMVPCGVFCRRLIGANVVYDQKTQSTDITFGKQTVTMTANSKTIQIDGKNSKINAAPILENGTMFISVRALADAFGIKITWNSDYHYTQLNDDRIMKTNAITSMMDSVAGNKVENNNAFVPTECTLKTTPIEGGLHWNLNAKFKNITGQDIAQGHESIQIYFDLNPWQSFNGLFEDSPLVKKDGTINKSLSVDYLKVNKGQLDYILLWGRTMQG
jgi:hypothetical protein